MGARIATLAVVALALATIPGSRVRPTIFERTVLPLPPSRDRDVDLTVHVRSRADERPLPRAHVRVLAMVDDRAYLAGSGETDARGQLELHALPRSAAWILADADGLARASTQRVLAGGSLSIDLTLESAHRLGVTVADDLGQPVAGAVIEATGADPLPVGAKTDPSGLGEVLRLGEGPWTVVAHAAGYEEVVRRGVREGEAPRLVLRKQGALLVSVAGEHGEPAPLARVQIAGASMWPARATDTAPDGTVRIGGLSAGSYALRATSGALVSATELGVPLARGEERSVTLRLLPGVFASARVVDGDAADAPPVPRARVTLVEGGLSPFPLEGLADATGSIRLGPIAAGPALLSAQAEGFVPRDSIDVPADGRSVTIVMMRAGTVEGRVVDSRGRPVDGATIEIVGSGLTGAPIDDDPRKQMFRRAQFDANLAGSRSLIPSGELGVVPGPVPRIPRTFEPPAPAAGAGAAITSLEEPWVTKDDGTFRAAPASPGRIRVIVRHPEFLEGLSEIATLAPGGAVRVDVVLHEGGTLDGRVVDAGGRSVAGANVTLAALRGSMERLTRTASDGTFAFAAVPDGVVVTASLGDDVDARVARKTLEVPDTGRATVTLTLPDARPPLDVHVGDDRGYPIGAAQVSVASVDPATPLRTTLFTDGHGDATIAGGRGVSLRLDVTAPGHAERAVQVARTDTSASVTLDPAETLTGTVRESRSGAPIRGAEVTLYASGGTGARRTVTDGAGRFTLVDVAAGPARVRIRAPARVTHTESVTVTDPTSHLQDLGAIDLAEEGVVLGTVVDPRGVPVAGARVGKDHVPTYVPAISRDASFAVTDARGQFRLGGLEDGVITLEAYAPDVGRARVGGVRVTAGSAATGVNLRLEAEGGEASSEPASTGGVAVTLGELSGEPREVVVVAVADGSEAERAGLAAGDVLLAIDGATVRSIGEARARLSGPVGDDVVIARRRGEEAEALRVPREAVRR